MSACLMCSMVSHATVSLYLAEHTVFELEPRCDACHSLLKPQLHFLMQDKVMQRAAGDDVAFIFSLKIPGQRFDGFRCEDDTDTEGSEIPNA